MSHDLYMANFKRLAGNLLFSPEHDGCFYQREEGIGKNFCTIHLYSTFEKKVEADGECYQQENIANHEILDYRTDSFEHL